MWISTICGVRTRLPTWVVRIRSLLLCIAVSPGLNALARKPQHAGREGVRARLAHRPVQVDACPCRTRWRPRMLGGTDAPWRFAAARLRPHPDNESNRDRP